MTATPVVTLTPIKVLVESYGDSGRFLARDEQGHQLTISHAPFLEAARVLLGRRIDPRTPILMAHSNNPDLICLRSTVGYAASMAVNESDTPRFKKFSMHPQRLERLQEQEP